MDFNKVFEQMFNSQNSENTGFDPTQYTEMLKGIGTGGKNSFIWIIVLLLLLFCGCGGNFGLGGYGGGCNNQCFDMCCRRKSHHCKDFKKYECYLDQCDCNNGCCNNGCGSGSWIWIIILIVVLCACKGAGGCKEHGRCSSNVINVDTAE